VSRYLVNLPAEFTWQAGAGVPVPHRAVALALPLDIDESSQFAVVGDTEQQLIAERDAIGSVGEFLLPVGHTLVPPPADTTLL
jgi:hypothetical protein